MRTRVALTAALLAALCARAAVAQNPPVTRVYEVGFLTRRGRPGPARAWLGLSDPNQQAAHTGLSGPRWAAGSLTDEAEEDDDSSVDALMNLIRDNLDRDTWEGEMGIRSGPGRLIVTHHPAIHARIAALLGVLRATMRQRVVLEVAVLDGPGAAADAVLDGGPRLDPARLATLGKPPWRRVAASRLDGLAGEPLRLARIDRSRYVRDVSAEVAEEVWEVVPELGRMRLGLSLSARAVPSSDGRALAVECRLGWARAAHETLPEFAAQVRFVRGAVRSVEPLTLQQPRVARRQLGTHLVVPSGGAAVIGCFAHEAGVRLVVLRHLPEPVAAAAPVAGVRVFEAAFLTTRRHAHTAPRLSPFPNVSSSGGPYMFAHDADEESALTTEALVEHLKRRVAPESWEAEDASIDTYAGRLVIVQTPANLTAVAAELARLEQQTATGTFVRTRLVEAPPAQRAALTALTGGLLVADRLRAARAAASAEGVTRLQEIGVLAGHGQRCGVTDIEERTYVEGYDVEVAQRSSITDPDVGHLVTGAALQARVVRAGTTEHLLTLSTAHSALLAMRAVPVGKGASFQLPTVRTSRSDARLLLPAGGGRLLDLGEGRFLLIETH